MRYFFEIAYNGSRYHGWQRQENAVTVQQRVEEAFFTIFRQKLPVTGSGRTDAGVHCRQQYFHIDYEGELPLNMMHRLNSYLPRDITLRTYRKVPEGMHARFSAVSRTYEYHIAAIKDPFATDQAFYLSRPLDTGSMNAAAQRLLGEKDFRAFSRVKTDVNHFICTVGEAQWQRGENRLIFSITASRFLRGMVRAIVGTLLQVGLGKIPPEDIDRIIKSKDRRQAGASAPAHGLFLTGVVYPQIVEKGQGGK